MRTYTLKHQCQAEMDCPKEVVQWNYYDHEHLIGTHYKYYDRARILAERDDWALVYRSKKMPFLPVYTSGIGLQYMDGDTMKTFHKDSWGFLLEQDTAFEDLPDHRCRVTVTYQIDIHPWLKFLEPVFHRLFQSWFIEVWAEDLPMRLRRWKVHQLGFKDFVGIEYINKKLPRPDDITVPPFEFRPPLKYTPPAYEFTPPIQSLKKIHSREGEGRIFTKNVELGYNDFAGQKKL